MDNQPSVKAVIVPREIKDNALYFYLVFTFSIPDDNSVPPGLLTGKWPEIIRDWLIDSSTFSVASFRDLIAFASKLKQALDPVSALLNSKMSAKTKKALTNYKVGDPVSVLLKTPLVKDLNNIISQTLYDKQQFAAVALRPETKRLQELNPIGQDLIRLNRLLLEDAYPQEIYNKLDKKVIINGQSFEIDAIPKYPEAGSSLLTSLPGRYSSGLGFKHDDLELASKAWKAIFGHRVKAAQDNKLHGKSGPRIGALQAMAKGGRMEYINADPPAATDLRPAHRIEMPNRQSLMKAHNAMISMSELRKGDLASAARHLDMAATTTAGLRKEAADRLQANAQTNAQEISRISRILETGRNRAGGGLAERSSRSAMDGQAHEPSIQELFGRVAQFPGLMRRLKLAIYCKTNGPSLPSKGTISLSETSGTLSWKETFIGKDVTYTIDVIALATEFEMGDKKTLLLDKDSFEISQDDVTAGAASLVSGGSSVAADIEQHGLAITTEAIGIYRTDQAPNALINKMKGAGERETHVNKLLMNRGNLRDVTAQAAHAAAKADSNAEKAAAEAEKAAKAAADAARTKVLEQTLQPADLRRGVSVDVKRDGSQQWQSLCYREVSLETNKQTDPEKDPKWEPLLTWIEEASVPLAALTSPAPAVGKLEGIENHGDIRLAKVKIFGTSNCYVSKDPRVFRITPETPSSPSPSTALSSLIRNRTTAGDLTSGDILRITADGEEGPYIASEVVAYPLLTTADTIPSSGIGTLKAESKTRNESFPMVIHGEATQFVNTDGSALDDKTKQKINLTNGFTVEGERRPIVANIEGMQLVGKDWKTQKDHVTVFASSIPWATLHVNHLDANADQLRLLPLRTINDKLGDVVCICETTPLELVRGFISNVFCDFGGMVTSVSNQDVTLNKKSETLKFTQEPKPAQGQVILGVAKLDSKGGLQVQSWVNVPMDPIPEKQSEEVRYLKKESVTTWRLQLEQLSGIIKEVSLTQFAPNGTSESPFIKPKDGLTGGSQMVECVVVRQGKRLLARHLPQMVFGTINGNKLTTPDGTVLPVPPESVASGTGFFELIRKEDGTVNATSKGSEHFRVAGEVVSVSSVSGDREIVMRAMGGRRTWALSTPIRAEFAEMANSTFRRRADDLEPGEFVIADTDILEDGRLRVAVDNNLLQLWAMSLGTAAERCDDSITMLRDGATDLLPLKLTTEGGQERTVWAPKAKADEAGAKRGEWVAAAMPAIYARTISLQPPKYDDPASDASSISPVTVSVSDAIARWNGWSLVVPEPGEADREDEETSPSKEQTNRKTPFRFTVRVPQDKQFKLPRLRENNTYRFRLRYADLAGNHGFDQQDNTDNGTAPIKYRRPDKEPTPLIAVAEQGAKSNDPLSVPKKKKSQKEDTRIKTRLVHVSDPLGEQLDPAGVSVEPQRLWLLPPTCAVSTIIKSGQFDRFPSPESLFEQHEKHFDDGTFRYHNGKLNYFPDPFIYPSVYPDKDNEEKKRTALIVADDSGATFQPLNDAGKQEPMKGKEIDLAGGKSWPECLPVSVGITSGKAPKVSAVNQSVTIEMPPSWTGRGVVRNKNTEAVWTDFEIMHATTAPRARPRWISLTDDMARGMHETADRFQGIVALHTRSTGSIGLTSYWNEYWDETPPLHFVEAKIACEIQNGKMNRVEIEDPGDGYGTVGRIVLEAAGAWRSGKGVQLPVIEATIDGGKLTKVRILDEGNGAGLPDDLKIRVLRRPPLTTFATGEVILGKNGKITEVKITRPGGYYASPPLVKFHDLSGDGGGAVAFAELDEQGGVARVSFEKNDNRGRGYSANTIVAFYTNSTVLPEILVPDPGVPDRAEFLAEQNGRIYETEVPCPFEQAFGDTKAREAIYVAAGATRFRELLTELQEEGKSNEKVPKARAREGAPQRVEVRATARPPRPQWHHHAYAFKWSSSNPPVKDSFQFPPGDPELVIQREGAIRCYLRRGWNATGRELLGVVVLNSEINTTQLNNLAPGRIIPGGMRSWVSRWGYDPVWDDTAVPPLTLDDLTNQTEFVPYENISEYTNEDERLAGIALHEIHYDSEKELYYADIGLRTPAKSLPFIQLALVRYQPLSLDGLAMSEVLLTDPIRVPGDRQLRIEKSIMSSGKFKVSLQGPFLKMDEEREAKLPRREVTVELRQRLKGYATEIEGPLANELKGAAGDQGPAKDSFQSQDIRVLKPGDEGDFSDEFQFKLPRTGNALYLRVVEREIYPTSEPQRDRTGDSGHPVKGDTRDASNLQNAADWIPFTCSVDLQDSKPVSETPKQTDKQ